MPARKMRIELFDDSGNKYSVSFEGKLTREKAVHLIDLVELLGGSHGQADFKQPAKSKYEKVQMIIHNQFPMVWFNSKEVQKIYEQYFKELIGLSTISTYLSRMVSRGFLNNKKTSKSMSYKIASKISKQSITQLFR